jgi:hypothetical protein
MAVQKERKLLSAKSFVDNHSVGSRGVGAVQLPDGVMFYKFKEAGTVRLDVVPFRSSKPELHQYAVDGVWFERTYFVHKNVGPDKATVVCPKATLLEVGTSKPCPICEYRNKLDWSDANDLKTIKTLFPQERQLFNVIILDKAASGEAVQKLYVLDQARFGFGQLLDNLIKNADEDDKHYEYYADMECGSTLKLNIEEKHTDTFKFFGVSSIEIKTRKHNYDESVLDRTVDLDRVLQILPYGTLKDMFFGIGEYAAESGSTTDEESEMESPKSSKSVRVTEDVTKKSKSSVEDDDDGVEVPVKQKKKVNVPIDDEEDDVPFETKPKPKAKPPVEDEEEEEPQPPKKKPKPPVEDEDEDNVPVKPKPKAKPPVDEDEEELQPPKKKFSGPSVDNEDPLAPVMSSSKSTAGKKSIVDDWEDED